LRRAAHALRRSIVGVLTSPGSYLIGPIFQREVRSAGRRRGTYLTRFAYVAIVLLVVSLAYLASRSSSQSSSTIGRIQELQQLAPVIAVSLFWAQFVLMVLIAPILTAGAVCDEKRGRTLAALMTTPLTSGQIILGKLSARMVQLVILALCVTPVLLAIRIFGGLDASLVVASTLATISTALLAASLAILLSCWHNRASTVVMFALLLLVLLQAAPLTLFGILASNEVVDTIVPIALMGTCAPVVLAEASAQSNGFSLITETGLDVSDFPGLWAWTPMNFALFNTAYNIFWVLAICLLASVTLRRVMIAEAGGAGSFRYPIVDAWLGIDGRDRFRLHRFLISVALPSLLLIVGVFAIIGPDAVNPLGITFLAVVVLLVVLVLLGAAVTRSKLLRAHRAEPVHDQSKSEPALARQPEDRTAGSTETIFSTSRNVGHRPVLWRELRQQTFGGQPVALRMNPPMTLAVAVLTAIVVASWRVSEAKLSDLSAMSERYGGDAIALAVKLALALAVLIAGVVLAAKGPVTIRFPVKLLYVLGVTILAALYLYIGEGFDNTGVTPFIATTASVGLILQASLMTTSGIAGERESVTWDTLLTTALSPTEILTGKFLGALRRMMLIPMIVLIHVTLAAMFGSLHPLGAAAIMLTILGPTIFLAGTGVLFSLLFRKSVRAAVANLALALCLWCGSWLVIVLIEAFGPYFEVESLIDVSYAISPPCMAFSAASGLGADSIAYRFIPYRNDLSIGNHDTTTWEFLKVTALVFAGYVSIGLGALGSAIYFFPNLGGRSS
jgi:ABC-type transport system involved in multi-copper enzyme maturation permease subunit